MNQTYYIVKIKKPIKVSMPLVADQDGHYTCPNCEQNHIIKEFKYCPDCGAMLFWQGSPQVEIDIDTCHVIQIEYEHQCPDNIRFPIGKRIFVECPQCGNVLKYVVQGYYLDVSDNECSKCGADIVWTGKRERMTKHEHKKD